MKHAVKFWFIFVILLVGNSCLFSQSETEPVLEKLKEQFKKEYFSVGVVFQFVADGQIERSFPGRSGFNIANMRLNISGELDKQFGYFLQANFINAPAILDAKGYYRFSRGLTIDGGLFKAPFSKEFLTPADAIDFVNRSRAAAVLTPGRQIGVQARGWFSEEFPIKYGAGIFNGNGFGGNVNDNNSFMYAGRLAANPLKNDKNSGKQLEIGINAAYSKDDFARLSELLNPFVFDALFFTGKRTLFGADVRYTTNKLLLAGEYILADFDGTITFLGSNREAESIKPSGFHLTGGYMLQPNLQLLGRLDSFKTDKGLSSSEWIILGLNYWPSQATELQFNYTIDTDDSTFKHHQLLINAQVAF